jgi:sterol desaturase/sphingolipid hydroxylase (fatty acid hydroxylase superfamily)
LERVLENQNDIHSLVLVTALAVTLVWEIRFPRREPAARRTQRWRVNFLLMLVNMAVLYAVVPITTVALAIVANNAGVGLFNRIEMPFVLGCVLGALLMDLARYGQHLAMHRIPLLWRIHRVHHADPDLDVTTSLRFHPMETIIGLITDALVIVVLGVPALAVVLYRLARVTASTLVHGNVRVPAGVDAFLRLIIVTPDMHRIHHSVLEREQGRNLSGGLCWWDRLFGTYVAAPASDYRTMALGLTGYPERRASSLRAALADPFAK